MSVPTLPSVAVPNVTTAGVPVTAGLLNGKRVLISVGAGGVGKTSTAAALGLLGARCGRRTLVMTIDPARRLAASLGIHGGLDHEQRRVPLSKLRAAAVPGELLYAMMLDQKRGFDEVIERHAPDPASAQRVRDNKLYREISTRLAGGQEYAAMEKLYELTRSDAYELLVLDTPPTANAMDFFDAPKKMVDLLSSPAVRLFLRVYESAGRFRLGLLSSGTALVFRRLARFVGGEFFDEVARFFADMQLLLEGFRNRAEGLLTLLRQPDVGIVVITSPEPSAVDEAIELDRGLRARGMGPTAFVINRVHDPVECPESEEQIRGRLEAVGIDRDVARGLADTLADAGRKLDVLAAADRLQIDRLVRACGEQHAYLCVPFFDDDVYDIRGLLNICRHLA